MNFNFLLVLCSLMMGSSVLIIGFILKNNPTKIGFLNGFRNKHSMKNQEQWDFSQQVFAKNLILYSWIPFLTSVLGFFVNEQNTLWGIWGIMICYLLYLVVAVLKTRDLIHVEFDKE